MMDCLLSITHLLIVDWVIGNNLFIDDRLSMMDCLLSITYLLMVDLVVVNNLFVDPELFVDNKLFFV
jgi:hypothetical protein